MSILWHTVCEANQQKVALKGGLRELKWLKLGFMQN